MAECEITLTYNNTEYVWDGERWYDTRTFMVPADVVAVQLNELIESKLVEADQELTRPVELFRDGQVAAKAGQIRRATQLLYRCLEVAPGHSGAATVLSSLLRDQGKADKALEVTDPFRYGNNPALLTTRAAALCDLELYGEALRLVRKALAISRYKTPAHLVYERIRAARPNLCPPK